MSNNQNIIHITDSDDEIQESTVEMKRLTLTSSQSEAFPVSQRPNILQGSSSREQNLQHNGTIDLSITEYASNLTIRGSNQRREKVVNVLGINTHSLRIRKDKSRRAYGSKPIRRLSNSSSSHNNRSLDLLLHKHGSMLKSATARERKRIAAGLPPSRLYFPTAQDSEGDHREFYVKQIEAKKIEEDIRNGYIERVEDRHVIQLDDLDPELLTGRPMTEIQRAWVQRKQARRAGPISSSFPLNIRPHDQHTEYIRWTEKARDIYDPNAKSCVECGSKLWGTATLYPLAQPAERYPSSLVVHGIKPLCLGCSRLFSCVKNRAEKMEMIYWIVKGCTTKPPRKPSKFELQHNCKQRVASMKKRASDHFTTLPDDFVTADQLYNDLIADEMRCYMVGSPMTLQPHRFNSVTFDHIKPISMSMNQPGCWSIHNLQPMAKCINTAKGNESNKEIKRYLLNFINHYDKD